MSEARTAAGGLLVESRYRRLIRQCYPSAWRSLHEEALLAMLVDSAEADGRSAPTAHERADLAVRGSAARLQVALPAAVRDRTASIAIGIGVGFAVVYGAVFIPPAPDPFDDPIQRHLGPAVVVVVWLAVLAAVFARRAFACRSALAVALLCAVTLPAVLADPHPGATDWTRPAIETAVFLGGVALLGLGGTPNRAFVIRSAPIAAVLTAAVIVVGMNWRDASDQALWASTSAGLRGGSAGELNSLWNTYTARMPLAVAAPDSSFTAAVRGWLILGPLRLMIIPVAVLAAGIVSTVALRVAGRRTWATSTALLCLPLLLALWIAVIRPTGIILQ